MEKIIAKYGNNEDSGMEKMHNILFKYVPELNTYTKVKKYGKMLCIF